MEFSEIRKKSLVKKQTKSSAKNEKKINKNSFLFVFPYHTYHT
jgi:hypothetical protein